MRDCTDDMIKINMTTQWECEKAGQNWTNHAFALYKQKMGDGVFKEKFEELFQVPSLEGFAAKSKVENQITKMKLLAFFGSLRKSHAHGVGGVGTARIVSDPGFPDHEFFKPGRAFPVRIYHSNAIMADDASADRRGAFLKFSDEDIESPLDMELVTGSVDTCWDIPTLTGFMKAQRTNPALKDFCFEHPIIYYGLVDSLRRAPDSYTDLRYYGHHVFHFRAKDAKERFVKFRLVPADGHPESGLLDFDDQRIVWRRERLPDEFRPQTYLRTEFAERLKKKPINYTLQLQLHEWEENDPYEIFNPVRVWDPDTHPWIDLAHVQITTLLPQDITERMIFNLGTQPESLGLVEPKSIYDHSSVPYLKAKVNPFMSKLQPINPPNPEPPVQLDRHKYTLEIHTGRTKGSGTDSTITVILVGAWARTHPIKLDQAFMNNFEAGNVDILDIEAVDVGEIQAMTLSTDSRGVKSDWYVDSIFVVDRQRGRRQEFPVYRWITDRSDPITLRSGNGTSVCPSVCLCVCVCVFFVCLCVDRQRGRRQEFPVYRWITDRSDPITLRSGNASLMSHDSPVLKGLRELELEKRRERYQWAHDEKGFPAHLAVKTLNDLPRDNRVTQSLKGRDLRNANKNGIPLRVKFNSAFRRWEKFDDCENLCKVALGEENVREFATDIWRTDFEFGRQILNECHPSTITRCKMIPPNFPVQDETLRPQLERGMNLKQEATSGRLYLMDCSLLDGLSLRKPDHQDDENEFHPTAPMALFYVNGKKEFVPIAIQLYPQVGRLMPSGRLMWDDKPGPENPIWTPMDSDFDWILAKMYLRSADAQIHQLVSNCLTQLVMEPFAVSTYRNLSAAHPVYKLLVPHVRKVFAHSLVLKEHVIGEGSILDDISPYDADGRKDLIRRYYANFKFKMLNFPAMLAEKGLDDKEALPGYYYRDDGLLLWEAISRYTGDILKLFYDDTVALRDDLEVQNWIRDVKQQGLQWEDESDKGLPDGVRTIRELADIVTSVIFTCSVHYAGHNAAQQDVYSLVPNAPMNMRRAPPKRKPRKGETEMEDIMDALPDRQASCKQLNMAIALSNLGIDEEEDGGCLGHFSDRYFTEDRAQGILGEFQQNLQQIAETIRRRNEALDVPYTHLLPEKVPKAFRV
ncbi:PREDICTED: allene oxide synthase-lipoxygenase protein-like [Branchiostoma belcheri]|uniref:Allene oxide synthase-lipoxygenase protein-like n=1 Tax=Branchiostoma belcheri TaxID=7741 RepID=A0A6P5AB40_BRABE|nr:PREDICTED: allene oxide synthase-lipoxygenase protein-like [Branchiostoma belcheri]